MNTTKLLKKLGVICFTLISVVAISITSLCSINANATFDYSTEQKVKSNEYVESLFDYDSKYASVTANYNAPDYYGLKGKKNENGNNY